MCAVIVVDFLWWSVCASLIEQCTLSNPTWITHVPVLTLLKPQLLKVTFELSAEIVIAGSD